ncbi:MAG: 50S ribosomal protein L29 [Anaerolineales bacterium]|jgi:large subunit ribosomal protein L29
MTVKVADIHALSTEEIRSSIEEKREEYFKLRFQYSTGQLTDHSKFKLVRRDIARLETILRQRELAVDLEASEG